MKNSPKNYKQIAQEYLVHNVELHLKYGQVISLLGFLEDRGRNDYIWREKIRSYIENKYGYQQWCEGLPLPRETDKFKFKVWLAANSETKD